MKSLKPYRFNSNPSEKQISDSFIKLCAESHEMVDLIVFGQSFDNNRPNDFLSDREKDIVVSTIQWLQTPVGLKFLENNGFTNKK